MEMENNGRNNIIESSSLHLDASSFRRGNSHNDEDDDEGDDDEVELHYCATIIERSPTFQRIRSLLFGNKQLMIGSDTKLQGEKGVLDVPKLGAHERRVFIDKLVNHVEHGNRRLLLKLKQRIDRYHS